MKDFSGKLKREMYLSIRIYVFSDYPKYIKVSFLMKYCGISVGILWQSLKSFVGIIGGIVLWDVCTITKMSARF